MSATLSCKERGRVIRELRRSSSRGGRFSATRTALLLSALFYGLQASAGEWHWTASVETARPTGWVQVRENDIEGTQLNFSDLGVRRRNAFRLDMVKTVSPRAEWNLSVATYALDGTTTIPQPITFNGATIAAGPLRTATHYTHFLEFDGSYRRRFLTFGERGGLWGSVGGTFMLLNFTLHGTLAPNTVGRELTEAFYVQELPVPVLGLHLKYPIVGGGWSLIASATAGGLPRVNSLRREGGEVRLKQTNSALSVGVAVRQPKWEWSLSAFGRHYVQDEQSREDSNVIHLRDSGLAVGLGRPF
jgi:hypothetical protein